ncbi:MAG: hypothetical protein RLZZ283_766 [Candidatus Parcubacteria bacterium]
MGNSTEEGAPKLSRRERAHQIAAQISRAAEIKEIAEPKPVPKKNMVPAVSPASFVMKKPARTTEEILATPALDEARRRYRAKFGLRG